MITPDLVVYGGTFDPPHEAHAASAAAALARFPAARLVVVPAPQPAGADGAHKHPTAPFSERLLLCELAFAALGARVTVDALEADLPPPHYTVRTLAEVRRRWPAAALGFLVGQDQLASFSRWREPRAVLAQASLVVVPRGETAGGGKASLLKTIAEVTESLDLTGSWQAEERALWLPGIARGIFALPSAVGEAASNLLRDLLFRGEPVPQGWLAPAVAAHIDARKLYRI